MKILCKFTLSLICAAICIFFAACGNANESNDSAGNDEPPTGQTHNDHVYNDRTTNNGSVGNDEPPTGQAHNGHIYIDRAARLAYTLENAGAPNQSANLLHWGFALLVDGNIFFADGAGIHKTSNLFETIETVVHNERNMELALQTDVKMFSDLQYHNGRIYFNDRTQNTIYSMNTGGYDIAPVFALSNMSHSTSAGSINQFILVDNVVFFTYLGENRRFDSELHSFCIQTEEIAQHGQESVASFSRSACGKYLYFAYGWDVHRMNLESKIIECARPNFYPYNNHPWLVTLHRSTINDGIITVNNNRIFVSDIFGNVAKIFQADKAVFLYTNNINGWIYFTAQVREGGAATVNSRPKNMYRIRYDGTGIERVHEILPNTETGIPSIFINIISEEIIFFKSAFAHTIYALIWDCSAGEFMRMAIN